MEKLSFLSLLSRGGHPAKHQPVPTLPDFGDLTGTGVCQRGCGVVAPGSLFHIPKIKTLQHGKGRRAFPSFLSFFPTDSAGGGVGWGEGGRQNVFFFLPLCRLSLCRKKRDIDRRRRRRRRRRRSRRRRKRTRLGG